MRVVVVVVVLVLVSVVVDCGGVVGGGGGVLDIIHGRSRMTIDPRIPTIPGRRTLGFHPPGGHCLLALSAKGNVRCSASRMKGEQHPTENRL